MVQMRGQGATEYLVLLAVVLIIALVSIALLGFFPGLASDAKITQSQSYWNGEASPFRIIESSVSASGGTAQIVLQNVQASGTYVLGNISLTGTNGSQSAVSPIMSFGSGETKNITISGGQAIAGTSGSIYDFAVVIKYTSSNGINSTQTGAKNLVGKYSS